MARNVRFRINSEGARSILRSEGVRGDLERRALQVAMVAEPQFEAVGPAHLPVEVKADSYTGHGRAGATVIAIHPAGARLEAQHRILGGAIDAAAT